MIPLAENVIHTSYPSLQHEHVDLGTFEERFPCGHIIEVLECSWVDDSDDIEHTFEERFPRGPIFETIESSWVDERDDIEHEGLYRSTVSVWYCFPGA